MQIAQPKGVHFPRNLWEYRKEHPIRASVYYSGLLSAPRLTMLWLAVMEPGTMQRVHEAAAVRLRFHLERLFHGHTQNVRYLLIWLLSNCGTLLGPVGLIKNHSSISVPISCNCCEVTALSIYFFLQLMQGEGDKSYGGGEQLDGEQSFDGEGQGTAEGSASQKRSQASWVVSVFDSSVFFWFQTLFAPGLQVSMCS